MTSVTLAPMTADEARALTDQINHAAGELWRLLLESYEREAWRALGYGSWRDYAAGEFGMSQGHAYRLLDQGRIIQEIEAETGFSPIGEITESQARALKGAPEGQRGKALEMASDATDGKPTAAAIKAAADELNGSAPARARDPNTSDVPAEFRDYDPVADAPDPHAEWERAENELQKAREQIAALESGEIEKQYTDLHRRYGQLEGRLNQEMRTRGEAEKDARYAKGKLKEVREALGVEKDREIIPAIRALLP